MCVPAAADAETGAEETGEAEPGEAEPGEAEWPGAALADAGAVRLAGWMRALFGTVLVCTVSVGTVPSLGAVCTTAGGAAGREVAQ